MDTTYQPVTLTVNGSSHPLQVEPRRTLLDVLRYDLRLTGTKKVCDAGNCGACTVIVNGQAKYSCLLLAVECDGWEITTIEGLGQGSELDPVQEAFIRQDAFQCGFCTSGQIMSLRALLDANPQPSEEQIARGDGEPLPLRRLPQHRCRRPPRRRAASGPGRRTARHAACVAVKNASASSCHSDGGDAGVDASN